MKAAVWKLGTFGGMAIAGAIAGCGGGGSSDPVATPPTTTALAVSGTAADSAAIASKTVQAKCATGAGSATTKGDGSYSISIDGGKLPCMASVTGNDGSVLHTVAAGSGNSATAHITPVTQLVVASLAGADPATYFAAFNTTSAATVTSAAVAAAQAAVVATLKSGGVDLSAVGDVIAGTLTPAAGNAYGTALTALANALTGSGTTLATLTTTVATTSTTSVGGAPVTSGTASLPADVLLKAAASNCSALRSGSYRVVFPKPGTALASQHGLLTINAATLGIVFTDGSTGSWVANGPCRFLGDSGRSDIVVSQAGVIVVRYLDTGTTYRLAVAFPEQAHTLAELAGTWNIAGLELNGAGTTYTGIAATATVDTAGGLSAVTFCQNDTTWSVSGADCASVTPSAGLKANSAGGFDVADTGTGSVFGRAFVYRAGGGELMMAQVAANGGVQMRTHKRVNVLPTVGAVNTSWDLAVTNLLASSGIVGQSSNTIVSVDTSANSWLRTQKTPGATDDHPETLFANNPRDGYTFRPASTPTAIDGTTVTVREWTNLGLRGMGVSALVRPTQKQFMLSVNQP